MSTQALQWFKSTYSGSEGGACLEVALSWRKSTYSSDEGGQCVEVAHCPTTIHIRDSKHPQATAPNLHLSPATWSAFTTTL
ncbi:DUF397 domain-containing protein [Streptomyces sp. NPDC004539]|uniref:DUF397 domain-containing protein n=1 Tax=Streptomyces sp. NPDC004539 TaxID=3154280 RepID=UPI0033B37040